VLTTLPTVCPWLLTVGLGASLAAAARFFAVFVVLALGHALGILLRLRLHLRNIVVA